MEPVMERRENHFVLVHGAGHGAWCWYKVATLLKSAGHKVTAFDLASCGIHPKQCHEVLLFSDYYEPLMEFMASLPPEEKVILVAHSAGGLSISAAMERFPEKVSVGVFAAAFMPSPDLSLTTLVGQYAQRLDTYMDTTHTFDANNQPTSLLFGPNFLASRLYQLSPPEDLELALSLVRPHPLHTNEALLNEAGAVTKEKYGSVRRVYIVCDQDYVIREDLQRWMIENCPPDEVKVIDGSDHMVMFSKPKELCSCLEEIAEKYP